MGLPFKKRFNSSLKSTKCQGETQCVKHKLREVARIMLESTGESDETKNELLQRFECEHEPIANPGVDTPMNVEEDVQVQIFTTPERSPPLYTSTPFPHLVQAEPMDLSMRSMRNHQLNLFGQYARQIGNDANNEQMQVEPLNLCLNNRMDDETDLEPSFDRDANTSTISASDDLDLDEFDIEDNTADRQEDVEEDAEDVSLYPEPYVYDDIDQYEDDTSTNRSVVPFPSEPINLSVRTENNESTQPSTNIGESEEEIRVGQQQPLDLRGNRRKCRKTLEF